jgi:hypothetical protein
MGALSLSNEFLSIVRSMNMTSVRVLFFGGVILAILAQIVAYRAGSRTWGRFWGAAIGITGAILIAAAGQIATIKLTDLVNFIFVITTHGGPDLQ